MPCQGGCGSPEPNYKQEVAKLSSLLCSVCRSLEDLNFDFDKNPELSRFWDEHKKIDEARLLSEARMRLEKSRCLELSNKKFGDLTKEELGLLKKHKFV